MRFYGVAATLSSFNTFVFPFGTAKSWFLGIYEFVISWRIWPFVVFHKQILTQTGSIFPDKFLGKLFFTASLQIYCLIYCNFAWLKNLRSEISFWFSTNLKILEKITLVNLAWNLLLFIKRFIYPVADICNIFRRFTFFLQNILITVYGSFNCPQGCYNCQWQLCPEDSYKCHRQLTVFGTVIMLSTLLSVLKTVVSVGDTYNCLVRDSYNCPGGNYNCR